MVVAPFVAAVPSSLTEGLFLVSQSGDPSSLLRW